MISDADEFANTVESFDRDMAAEEMRDLGEALCRDNYKKIGAFLIRYSRGNCTLDEAFFGKQKRGRKKSQKTIETDAKALTAILEGKSLFEVHEISGLDPASVGKLKSGNDPNFAKRRDAAFSLLLSRCLDEASENIRN